MKSSCSFLPFLDLVNFIHYISIMPPIKRFSDCKVCIHADEHNPPHFHVDFSDGTKAVVLISGMEVIAGNPRRLRAVLKWARENVELIEAKWKEIVK